MNWKSVLDDPTFQEQPLEVKKTVASNYYKTYIEADSSFQAQPDEIKEKVRTNLFASIEPQDEKKGEEGPGFIRNSLNSFLKAGFVQPYAMGEELLGMHEEAKQTLQSAEESLPTRPGISEKAGNIVGSVLPNIGAVGVAVAAPILAPTAAAGAAIAGGAYALMALYMGTQGAGQALYETRTYEDTHPGVEVDDDVKLGLAISFGLLGAATEGVSSALEAKFIKAMTPTVVKKVAKEAVKGNLRAVAKTYIKNGLVEGTEEAVEQSMQNALSKWSYDRERRYRDGITDNFVAGFVGGGVITGFGTLAQNRASAFRKAQDVKSTAKVIGQIPKKAFTQMDEQQLAPSYAKQHPVMIDLGQDTSLHIVHTAADNMYNLTIQRKTDKGIEVLLSGQAPDTTDLRQEVGALNTRKWMMNTEEAKAEALKQMTMIEEDRKLGADAPDKVRVRSIPIYTITDKQSRAISRTKAAGNDNFFPIKLRTPVQGKQEQTVLVTAQGSVDKRTKQRVLSALAYLGDKAPHLLGLIEGVRIFDDARWKNVYGNLDGAAARDRKTGIITIRATNDRAYMYAAHIAHEAVHAREAQANPTFFDILQQLNIDYEDQITEAAAYRGTAAMARDWQQRAEGPLRYYQHAEKGTAIPRERVEAQVQHIREAGVPITGGLFIHPDTLLDNAGKPVRAYYEPSTDSMHFSKEVRLDTVGHEVFEHYFVKLGDSDPVIQQGIEAFGGDKEALADAIGQHFAGRVESQGLRAKVQSWLATFWSRVKEKFGASLSAQDIVRILNERMMNPDSYIKANPEFAQGAPDRLFQVDAWQGTNRTFEKHDDNFVRSGEGSNSRGWGHYVSEAKSIGEYYAELLGRPAYKRGKLISLFGYPAEDLHILLQKEDIKNREKIDAGSWMETIIFDLEHVFESEHPDRMWEQLRRTAKHIKEEYGNFLSAKQKLILTKLENTVFSEADYKLDEINEGPTRTLLRVSLHKGQKESEYFYQDWDKPIEKRSFRKAIAERLVQEVGSNVSQTIKFEGVTYAAYYENRQTRYVKETGRTQLNTQHLSKEQMVREVAERLQNQKFSDSYQQLQNILGTPKAASKFLDSIGINGTRYQAGTMSGQASDAYNYVVYNPENITIEDTSQYTKRISATNPERLGLSASEENLIKFVLGQREIPPQTHAETWGKALEVLNDKEHMKLIIDNATRNRPLDEGEAVALREVARRATAEIMTATWHEGASNEEVDTIQGMYKRILDANDAAAHKAGLILNSYKIQVGNGLTKALAALSRPLRPDEKERLGKVDFANPISVRDFVQSLKEPTVTDYLREFWYGSILSGPANIVNFASNTLWFASMIPHRMIEAGVDAGLAVWQGRERRIFVRELVPFLSGAREGARLGAQTAGEILRTGSVQTINSKWMEEIGVGIIPAFERSSSRTLRLLAPFVGAFPRLLKAADVFANSIAYEAQIRALAYREGIEKGLAAGSTALEAHIQQTLANPSAQIKAEAAAFAHHATFMDAPGKLTKSLTAVRNAVPGGWLVLPFIRTMANITKRGLEFVPGVGVLVQTRDYARIRENKNVALRTHHEMRNEVASIVARQIEAAMLTAIVASMFDDDDITGPPPSTPAERDAFFRQGKIPFAIRLGDTWYSYRRVEPLNTLLSTVAVLRNSLVEAKDADSAYEAFWNTTNAVYMNFVSNSFVSNVMDMSDAYSARKYFERLPSTFVPYSAFMKTMANAIDAAEDGHAVVRESGGIVGQLTNTIPYLRNTPARLNAFGEESVIQGGFFRQWLPYKVSEETNDPIEKELERLNATGIGRVYPAVPEKFITINNTQYEIPDERYRVYAASYGQASKAAIQKMIERPSYKRLPDDRKILMLHRAMEVERRRVRNKVKREILRGQR